MKLLVLLAFCITLCYASSDTFEEELIVTDLSHSLVALHFNFVTKQPMSEKPTQHFHMFPKPISELMTKYSVNELHLSLVRGFWDTKQWGYPFVPAASGAAELWAWFSQNTRNVDLQWRQLTQSLSGMFCASLNQLADSRHSVMPRWSFRPEGLSKARVASQPEKHLRYGQLPHESVCTENLTPWIRLLPCKNKAGLVRQVISKKLFLSRYYALSLAVRPVCWDAACIHLGVELRQTLTVVLDRYIYNEASLKAESWPVLDILDTCPMASSSRLLVVPLVNGRLEPLPSRTLNLYPYEAPSSSTKSNESSPIRIGLYEVHQHLATGDKRLPVRVYSGLPLVPGTMVSLAKFSTGVGNEMGGVRAVITSRHDKHLTVVYTDLLPWFTRMEYRSLEFAINGRVRKPKYILYRPSRARTQMAHMEAVLDLPAEATLTVTYKFRKLLQRWNEYPPDANHGFYLPAASLSFRIAAEDMAHIPPLHPTRRALPQWAATYTQL